MTVGDVDVSRVASQIFLDAATAINEGTLSASADENAADFSFAVTLTSVPAAPVVLRVARDVDRDALRQCRDAQRI